VSLFTDAASVGARCLGEKINLSTGDGKKGRCGSTLANRGCVYGFPKGGEQLSDSIPTNQVFVGARSPGHWAGGSRDAVSMSRENTGAL